MKIRRCAVVKLLLVRFVKLTAASNLIDGNVCCVGEADGANVGRNVGADGRDVGCDDGCAVGCREG